MLLSCIDEDDNKTGVTAQVISEAERVNAVALINGRLVAAC